MSMSIHRQITISYYESALKKTGPILQPYPNLHSNDNPSDFPFSANLGGRNKGYLKDGSTPQFYSHRVGWGCGWLGPSLSSVLANVRARMGDKGQPLQMTILSFFMSQAQ